VSSPLPDDSCSGTEKRPLLRPEAALKTISEGSFQPDPQIKNSCGVGCFLNPVTEETGFQASFHHMKELSPLFIRG
jgi:hypothetical protein